MQGANTSSERAASHRVVRVGDSEVQVEPVGPGDQPVARAEDIAREVTARLDRNPPGVYRREGDMVYATGEGIELAVREASHRSEALSNAVLTLAAQCDKVDPAEVLRIARLYEAYLRGALDDGEQGS